MSSNLVIVAIPEKDDRVWKVSSEKVPHLTLLFLGDAEGQDVEGIAQFVQHATNVCEHGPFYLDVDHRDTLGPDDADVLFFNKRSYNLKWIKQFRSQLLQNGAIKTAYDSVENQYPEWLPHLTLGYPETPAKKLDDAFDDRIYSVNFDRIAVWTGDYEGPEFRLEWPEREFEDMPLSVAYSDVGGKGAEFLEHYGVKGMQWGVRKERPTAAHPTVAAVATAYAGWFNLADKTFRDTVPQDTKTSVSMFGIFAYADPKVRKDLKDYANQLETNKADKKWTKDVKNGKAWVAINNASAEHFNQHIDALNAKHPDNVNKDWTKDEKYMGDVKKLTAASLEHAANQLQMHNPSGTKKVVAEPDESGMGFTIRVEEVKHADGSPELHISVKYLRDADGRVTGFELDEGDVEHSALVLSEELVAAGAAFLEHYGVKGMKWGVSKQRFQSRLHERRLMAEEKTRAKRPAQGVRAYPTIGSSKRKKAKVDTKGGVDHPPTDDAVKVAVAKQKLKKSGPAALTNNELRDVQQRLNLENDVARLMKGQRSAGQKFVDGLLGRGDKNDRKATEYQLGDTARGVAGTVIKKKTG